MRHRNHSRRLSQKPHHARMLLRNLVTSLILYERIRTTKKRASVVRPIAERVISMGKTLRKDLAIRRMHEIVTHPNASKKIIEVFAPRFKNRSSGFLSIKPVGMRGGDGASLVDIVLVGTEFAEPPVEGTGKNIAMPTSSSAQDVSTPS